MSEVRKNLQNWEIEENWNKMEAHNGIQQNKGNFEEIR